MEASMVLYCQSKQCVTLHAYTNRRTRNGTLSPCWGYIKEIKILPGKEDQLKASDPSAFQELSSRGKKFVCKLCFNDEDKSLKSALKKSDTGKPPHASNFIDHLTKIHAWVKPKSAKPKSATDSVTTSTSTKRKAAATGNSKTSKRLKEPPSKITVAGGSFGSPVLSSVTKNSLFQEAAILGVKETQKEFLRLTLRWVTNHNSHFNS